MGCQQENDKCWMKTNFPFTFGSWILEFWEHHLGAVCKSMNGTITLECVWLTYYQQATLQNGTSKYLFNLSHHFQGQHAVIYKVLYIHKEISAIWVCPGVLIDTYTKGSC